jgi:hypothetical protein
MSLFDSSKSEQVKFDPNMPSKEERSQYTEIVLKDAVDDERYTGQPYLTEIYENEGDKGKYYVANLYITNDTKKEVLKARISFKNNKDPVKAFKGSALFDVIDSLERLNDPDLKECNKWEMNFDELQDYINSLEVVTVKIIENPPIKKGADYYNTLRFTRVS